MNLAISSNRVLQSCVLPGLCLGLQLQDCESEIQQLEHKLSDYRDIIGQQEVMLQVHMSAGI